MKLYQVERVKTTFALASSEEEALRLVDWRELDHEDMAWCLSPAECRAWAAMKAPGELIFHAGTDVMELSEAACISLDSMFASKKEERDGSV